MYELTCPSCQKNRRFAFIRLGARSVCPGCNSPFIIKAEHFSRQIQVATTGAGTPERDPLTSVSAPTPPPPTANAGITGLHAKALAHLARVTGSQQGSQQTPVTIAAQAASPALGQAVEADASALAQASQTGQPAVVHSTAVPIATAAGTRAVPPVSRLIAAKIRQKRRKQMVTWLTLIFVVLLFGVIAAMLVGLNRTPPQTANPDVATATVAPVTLNLYKVGPPRWEEMDEMAYPLSHNEPLGLEDYGLIPLNDQGESMIVGTVVCSSFDLYDSARLQLLLLDGESRIFARTDISLPPMSGQRENARQAIRIAVPKHLHARLSTVDWEVISGNPMNDGVMISPHRVISTGKEKDTRLRVVYQNQTGRTIHRLSLSVRAVDDRGKPLVHWVGQWKHTLLRDDSVELLIPTPLDSTLPHVGDWQINTAAELADAPLIAPPDDEDFLP